jgi:hypothetical protein
MPDSTLNRRSVALLERQPNELSYPQKQRGAEIVHSWNVRRERV